MTNSKKIALRYLSKTADNVPKTVKRYVEEHLEQGNDEGKAYALAWSRYCKYKYPNSPHCKKDNYFEGKKSSSRIEQIVKKISEGKEYKEAAIRVASRYYNKQALMINLPSQLVEGIKRSLKTFIKEGISPFPTIDPQRLESILAKEIRHEMSEYLRGQSLSVEDAHKFVRDLVREAKVEVTPSIIASAIQEVGYSLEIPQRMLERFNSMIDDMANGLAEDTATGPERAQKHAIRLLIKIGLEEWEAQQVLQTISSQAKVELPLASDQIDLIFSSYLKTGNIYEKQEESPSEIQRRKELNKKIDALSDDKRKVEIEFGRNENGVTQVEGVLDDGEEFSILPVPESFANFMESVDHFTVPGDFIKASITRIASRYVKEAMNMDYFDQRREVPWKFMEEDPYDHAMMALREPLARWTEFPSRSLKDEIVDIWQNLHPELKEALNTANRKAMGSSSIMWRVESSGNFPTDFGGYSMHDSLERGRVTDFIKNLYDVRRGEPLSQAKYNDPSEWEIKNTIQGYKVKVDDVLIHYGTPRNPLGDGRWSFEKEIILKPGAKPKPLSGKELLKNLAQYLDM